MKKLVIVESPAKTKKISKFLGKDFEVLSSVGHIRDLPKSNIGVDIKNDFKPDYIVDPKKKDVIDKLKKAAKNSETVYLATDPDREGEAIAWHVGHVINDNSDIKTSTKSDEVKSTLDKIKNKDGEHPFVVRVTFNSITKEAVLEAFKKPRKLDQNLIDAQQARRVLDRLVGYKLSPLLWNKIRYGLSAGRVQSVAVRFVVEREKEIKNFIKEKYYDINAIFASIEDKKISASLMKINGENIYRKKHYKLFSGDYSATLNNISSKQRVEDIVADLAKVKEYKITDVNQKETKKYPSPPFTTSSLQQSASTNLGISPKRTMQIAQKLYEDGYITYMRTDSTHIIPAAVDAIRDYIKTNIGSKYVPEKAVFYSKKKGVITQEAHEAIRPTDISIKSDMLPKIFNDQSKKIYNLIWQKAVASQMVPAIYLNTKLRIENSKGVVKDIYSFEADGSVIKFDGFTKVYRSKREDVILPDLVAGEKMALFESSYLEKELTAPPRYNESSLIKELERFNIGRPSTYATIMSTIQSRGYVVNNNKVLFPTDSGVVVNGLLVDHFKDIVDIDFTSNMENELDEIAIGEKSWVKLLTDFYEPFENQVVAKMKEIKKEDVVVIEKVDEMCPECKEGNLIVKLGKYGKFLSCDRYPECKYAKPMDNVTDPAMENGEGEVENAETQINLEGRKCPEDQGDLVIKQGRFGKFIACSNYPKCKFTEQIQNKINMPCPECGKDHNGEVVIKKTKKGRSFYGCSRYPDCKFASWKKPDNKKSKIPKK